MKNVLHLAYSFLFGSIYMFLLVAVVFGFIPHVAGISIQTLTHDELKMLVHVGFLAYGFCLLPAMKILFNGREDERFMRHLLTFFNVWLGTWMFAFRLPYELVLAILITEASMMLYWSTKPIFMNQGPA